jgi:oligogalacturonide lyase
MTSKGLNRRQFIGSTLALGLAGCATTGDSGSTPESTSENIVTLDDIFPSFEDEVTGARIYNLTPDDHKNEVIYQTHPQWTPRLTYLVFSSDRSGGGMRPHAIDMRTGEARVLGPKGIQGFALSPSSGLLLFVKDNVLHKVPVGGAYAGAAEAEAVGPLPENIDGLSGGMSVDANNRTVYIGLKMAGVDQWGIVAMDSETGDGRGVASVDFQVGHVQANPWQVGDIMFCHETGGDAPQRMWFVRANGEELMPFYKETYDEWVTHECWWGKDRAIFTVWPYDDAHKAQPHGIAVAKKGSDEAQILAEYPAWHTQGSPNGLYAMGDDFDRNLWLVDVLSRERRLLTQGHNTKGIDSHPHASFTPDSQGILFNSSKNGSEQIFLAQIPEWGDLPRLTNEG